MYLVYVNSLLHVLSVHNYAICITSPQLTSPSFADDITLLALHPSFLGVFMCHQYSIKWRYEFNHTKCGVVTLGESNTLHFQSMKERVWKQGNDTVDEIYEYKNLRVLKNFVGSFSSNVTDSIEKTREKAGMIFSSKFDRRKTNPLVYIKFWKRACLPSLLFGRELFTLTPSLLLKLERCQLWFLKNIFYLPSSAHSTLILKLSGLNFTESKIDVNRPLFLRRLITEPKMATVVKNLFRSRAESYFDSSISSTGVLPNIFEASRKYGLFDYFKLWSETSVFPVYSWWKKPVRCKVRENQNEVWSDFCLKHPDLKQAYDCLNNVPPYHFWSLANHYPDLVSRLHVQVMIMGISVLMAVFPGSLIPKVQLALFVNKVWKLLITFFSSVLGSKKTLIPFGTS